MKAATKQGNLRSADYRLYTKLLEDNRKQLFVENRKQIEEILTPQQEFRAKTETEFLRIPLRMASNAMLRHYSILGCSSAAAGEPGRGLGLAFPDDFAGMVQFHYPAWCVAGDQSVAVGQPLGRKR